MNDFASDDTESSSLAVDDLSLLSAFEAFSPFFGLGLNTSGESVASSWRCIDRSSCDHGWYWRNDLDSN